MVQIIDQGPSGISRFLQHASPGIDSTVDRFLERKKEDRKRKSDLEAEQRKIQNQKDTARALGLPEVAMEPSVQASLLKEKSKDTRNQQLLQALGIDTSDQMDNRDNESEDLTDRDSQPYKSKNSSRSQGINVGDLSDAQIQAVSILNPQLGGILQKQQESKQKQIGDKEKELRKTFQDEREFEWKRAGDILKKTDEVRDALEEKKAAANLIKQTASSEDTSGWGPWFADVLGVEPLRNANTALLKSATKDFFINNLAKAGSRPNQWIEQQISDAMVKIGRSKEANMVVAELMDYWVDRESEKVRLIDEIEDEDIADQGFVKGDIGKRASQRMKQWEDKRRDQLMYQIQQVKERENPDELSVIRQVAKGTPLTREKAKIFKQRYGKDAEKAARKAGYDVEIFARV